MSNPRLDSIIRKLRTFFVSTAGIYLAIVVPAAAAFIAIVPPAWGLDERVHTQRAYQVSEGNLYPDKIVGGEFGGNIPKSLADAVSYGHYDANMVDKAAPFFSRQDVEDPKYTTQLNNRPINTPKTDNVNFAPAGPYVPVVYAPAALGMYVGRHLDVSVVKSLQFAKILQATVLIAAGFFILKLLRETKLKWIFFSILLLPSTVFLSTTINADAYTITVTLLFIAYILRLSLPLFNKRKALLGKSEWIMIGVLSGLLAIAKPSYVLLVLLLCLIPTKKFTSLKQRVFGLGAIAGGAVIVSAASVLKGMQFSGPSSLYWPPELATKINTFDQMHWVLSHPIHYLATLIKSILIFDYGWYQSFIGLLGHNSIATPFTLMFLCGTALVIAALYAREEITRKQALGFLVTGVAIWLLIITTLYLTFNAVGSERIGGVQGRYFIPIAPLVLLGMARMLPVEIRASARSMQTILIAVSATTLYITLLAYIEAITD